MNRQRTEMVAETLNSDGKSHPEVWSATLSAYFVVVVSMAIWIAYTRLQIRIDGDDALRLLQVRDLLGGQNWFDLTQHRLGFAEGMTMSLSRLVDAPIAGLILTFDLFLERGAAETLAMIVWPGMLFCVVVACLYTVCYRLGGPKAAVYGTILASILLVQTKRFDPGSLDHTNLQMALVALAIVSFVMRRPVTFFAGLGGVCVALSVGIGAEMAAEVIVIFMAFATVWALRGEPEKRFVTAFAVSGAITLCIAFVVSAPVSAYHREYCGALSIDIALPALVASLGLIVIARTLSNTGYGVRCAGVAGLTLSVIASAWALSSTCSTNPYVTLDPLLQKKLLDHVVESTAVGEFSRRALGAFVGCFVGWLISVWFVARDLRRDPWTLLCLLLAVSLMMAAYQGRYVPMMAMLSVLPTSILAARFIERKSPNANIWTNVASVALLLISIPAVTGAATAMKAAAEHVRSAGPMPVVHRLPMNGVACSSGADLDELTSLTKGAVFAPFDLAPHILLHTPHRVLSVPDYQNREDLLAQLGGSNGTPKRAPHRIRELGVTYLVHCRDDVDYAKNNPGVAPFRQRDVGAGVLRRIRPNRSKPLSIYRVLPENPRN